MLTSIVIVHSHHDLPPLEPVSWSGLGISADEWEKRLRKAQAQNDQAAGFFRALRQNVQGRITAVVGVQKVEFGSTAWKFDVLGKIARNIEVIKSGGEVPLLVIDWMSWRNLELELKHMGKTTELRVFVSYWIVEPGEAAMQFKNIEEVLVPA